MRKKLKPVLERTRKYYLLAIKLQVKKQAFFRERLICARFDGLARFLGTGFLDPSGVNPSGIKRELIGIGVRGRIDREVGLPSFPDGRSEFHFLVAQ